MNSLQVLKNNFEKNSFSCKEFKKGNFKSYFSLER